VVLLSLHVLCLFGNLQTTKHRDLIHKQIVNT